MRIVHTTNDDYIVSGTPAAVSLDGILYINDDLFYELTPFQQEFVKWHEIGHYRLHTHSEFKADEYAFNKMAGKYYQSLKKMIGTLETILDEDENPDVKERIESLYKLCLQYDAERGNKRAAEELTRFTSNICRGDGNRTAEAIQAAGNATTDALNASGTNTVATIQANSSANNGNNIMVYIMIGLILFLFLKDK